MKEDNEDGWDDGGNELGADLDDLADDAIMNGENAATR